MLGSRRGSQGERGTRIAASTLASSCAGRAMQRQLETDADRKTVGLNQSSKYTVGGLEYFGELRVPVATE